MRQAAENWSGRKETHTSYVQTFSTHGTMS
jgi:hypothetical protein